MKYQVVLGNPRGASAVEYLSLLSCLCTAILFLTHLSQVSLARPFLTFEITLESGPHYLFDGGGTDSDLEHVVHNIKEPLALDSCLNGGAGVEVPASNGHSAPGCSGSSNSIHTQIQTNNGDL